MGLETNIHITGGGGTISSDSSDSSKRWTPWWYRAGFAWVIHWNGNILAWYSNPKSFFLKLETIIGPGTYRETIIIELPSWKIAFQFFLRLAINYGLNGCYHPQGHPQEMVASMDWAHPLDSWCAWNYWRKPCRCSPKTELIQHSVDWFQRKSNGVECWKSI
jgi:hypothetical protein